MAKIVRHEELSTATSRPEDRLRSWKEIAVYLRREVRTVQRWEKQEGLPVHRHVHNKLSSVYAEKAELEAWWKNRKAQLEEEGKVDEEVIVPVAWWRGRMFVSTCHSGRPYHCRRITLAIAATLPSWSPADSRASDRLCGTGIGTQFFS